MVKVAIAGGSGAVGRTILEVLKDKPQHEAVVLTRKPLEHDLGVPALAVDYSDVDALSRTLSDHSIHTVISALGNTDTMSAAQLNLIRAADLSAPTKRFIPSNYGIAYPPETATLLPTFAGYFTALDALEQTATPLEWTDVHNGVFLDYFAQPGKLPTHLAPHQMVVDMAHRAAALPGDGTARVTFTYTFDVARYVVALLGEADGAWPRRSRIAGDTVSWNEFVRLAEEVTGTKFDVVYDDAEKLRRGEVTELPFHADAYARMPKETFRAVTALFELWSLDEGLNAIPGEVNAKFPDIKPLSVKEMLERCWKA